MMRDFLQQFAPMLGSSPTDAEYYQGGIAAVIVIVSIFLGWLLSHGLGPRLATIWENRAGYESELARRRIRDMVRRSVESLLITIAVFSFEWSQIALVVFSITLAISTGLLVNDFIRGVRLPDWLGTTMGLIVFVAILGSLVGGIEPITQAMEKVGFDIGERRFSLRWAVTIMIAIVVLLATVRIISRIATHTIDNTERLDDAQKLLTQKMVSIVLIVVAFFVGLDVLGIDLTALSFFSGAFGLAVGFGMQKTIGNLFAGILLLMDRSIKPGDIIVVGDSFGWVNKIGVRAVSVLTRDGKEHLIPNENLMTMEVENWSFSNDNVRLKIPIGVSYNSDMRLVQELLYKAVGDSKRVQKKPEPRVWMLEFKESSVKFEIRCWINDPQEGVGNIQADIMMRVWDLFKEHGIEIPFPQRDLHVKHMPPPPEPIPVANPAETKPAE